LIIPKVLCEVDDAFLLLGSLDLKLRTSEDVSVVDNLELPRVYAQYRTDVEVFQLDLGVLASFQEDPLVFQIELIVRKL
jgi:hypothetical protein